MIAMGLAIALTVAAGYLGARRYVGRPLEAVLLAPVVTGLLLTPPAVLAVVTATDPLPWTIITLLGTNAVLLRMRRTPATRVWHPQSNVLAVALVAVGFAAVAGIYLSRPPVDWDAHLIWLQHAHWFAVGGQDGRDAFTLTLANHFPHAQYPPLLPASGGLASRLVGAGFDWRVAQAAIAAVSWSALATSAAVLIHVLRRRQWLAAIGALCFVPVVVSRLYVGVANAEADFGAGALLLLATLALVVAQEDDLVPLGIIAASGAALAKGESFTGVLIVVAIAWMRSGTRTRERDRWLIAPLAAGFAWLLVSKGLGASNYLFDDPGELSLSRITDRSAETLRETMSDLARLGTPALVSSATLLFLAPTRRVRRALLGTWIAIVWYCAMTTVVYVLGNFELTGWLASSLRRICTAPELLIVAILIIVIVSFVDVLVGGDGDARAGPDDGRRSRMDDGSSAPPHVARSMATSAAEVPR